MAQASPAIGNQSGSVSNKGIGTGIAEVSCLDSIRRLLATRATHQSPYGVIRSEWQHDQGRFTWELTIPPNTTATVAVPTDDPSAVREGGKALSAVKGLGVGERREGRVVLTVPAGKYRFSAPLRD